MGANREVDVLAKALFSLKPEETLCITGGVDRVRVVVRRKDVQVHEVVRLIEKRQALAMHFPDDAVAYTVKEAVARLHGATEAVPPGPPNPPRPPGDNPVG